MIYVTNHLAQSYKGWSLTWLFLHLAYLLKCTSTTVVVTLQKLSNDALLVMNTSQLMYCYFTTGEVLAILARALQLTDGRIALWDICQTTANGPTFLTSGSESTIV